MPHLTLEYSANLTFDVQALLARLHQQLAATGAIALRALKSRAVCQEQYRMAGGNPEYAFVHVNLLIRSGRPLAVQQEIARSVMKVLEENFGARFESGYLSLSVDVKEMVEGLFLTHHNIPDR
jgi:5-carboxymethyl-2-hydroxymuconate isomerase